MANEQTNLFVVTGNVGGKIVRHPFKAVPGLEVICFRLFQHYRWRDLSQQEAEHLAANEFYISARGTAAEIQALERKLEEDAVVDIMRGTVTTPRGATPTDEARQVPMVLCEAKDVHVVDRPHRRRRDPQI